ncbi:MAG TPA: GntR family transcriptional regulator [Syntrophomonas sp.]|jgi:GntR family transcriptional regulator|nr:GntR family transcriptional regulator [Syntrophomonas sp.]
MFELDLRSRVPIYEQMVEKFKELIINKVLQPDEQLPTVRVLAGQLTVNPNTIQKAYRELEHLGYIYSVPGKGHFVISPASEIQPARRDNLKQELLKIVAELNYLGVKQDDIVSWIKGSGYKGGQESDD